MPPTPRALATCAAATLALGSFPALGACGSTGDEEARAPRPAPTFGREERPVITIRLME